MHSDEPEPDPELTATRHHGRAGNVGFIIQLAQSLAEIAQYISSVLVM